MVARDNRKTSRPPRAPKGASGRRPRAKSDAYICKKCGCRSDVKFDWLDPNMDSWNLAERDPIESILLCPKDGPDEALLTEPTGRYGRNRHTYTILNRKVRACAPFMRLEPSDRPRWGPVLQSDEVLRELYLRHYLKKHGPDAAIDLVRIADVDPESHTVRIHKVGGAWVRAFSQKNKKMI